MNPRPPSYNVALGVPEYRPSLAPEYRQLSEDEEDIRLEWLNSEHQWTGPYKWSLYLTPFPNGYLHIVIHLLPFVKQCKFEISFIASKKFRLSKD